MKYQVVIQWPEVHNVDNYDKLIRIENDLIKKLSNKHEVDGHDVGSGELNIFIITNNPLVALGEIQNIMKDMDIWPRIRIGYRENTEDAYGVLWPEGLSGFKVS